MELKKPKETKISRMCTFSSSATGRNKSLELLLLSFVREGKEIQRTGKMVVVLVLDIATDEARI